MFWLYIQFYYFYSVHRSCSFLWVYYGNPASSYERINVEVVRNNCGKALAKRDKERGLKINLVAGIPDSGTPHSVGYANEMRVAYGRPFIKYTETWQRSFMPQEQEKRQLVADMKLIPVKEIIRDKSIVICDDSLVRGTQMRGRILQLFRCGAKEVHVRLACPPLIYRCEYLNFSQPSKYFDLAARRAILKLEGISGKAQDITPAQIEKYRENKELYAVMIEEIRKETGATSIQYQKLEDLVSAIGMPKENLCTYCWDGCKGCKK